MLREIWGAAFLRLPARARTNPLNSTFRRFELTRLRLYSGDVNPGVAIRPRIRHRAPGGSDPVSQLRRSEHREACLPWAHRSAK